MRIFLDDLGYDLSRRRVTLSTSGLVPQIYKLAEECNVALAVSLHAPNDALRNELVPINRKHPIDELLAACWHYIDEQNGRSVTFEYVMLDGVNDKPEHARQLARLLQGPAREAQSDSLQRVSRHALPPFARSRRLCGSATSSTSTASSRRSAERAATTSMRPAGSWRAGSPIARWCGSARNLTPRHAPRRKFR